MKIMWDSLFPPAQEEEHGRQVTHRVGALGLKGTEKQPCKHKYLTGKREGRQCRSFRKEWDSPSWETVSLGAGNGLEILAEVFSSSSFLYPGPTSSLASFTSPGLLMHQIPWFPPLSSW